MTFSLTPTSHYRTTQPLLYIYSTPIPAQTTIVQRATSITQSPTSPPPTLHLLHQDGEPPSLYGGTFTPPAAPPLFHTVITLLAHLPHPDTFPVLAHFPYATLSLPSDGGVALR